MSRMDVARLRMGALKMVWQQEQQRMWNGLLPKTQQGKKQDEQQGKKQDEQQGKKQDEQQQIKRDGRQETWKGAQLEEGQYQQEASAFSAGDFSTEELKKAVTMSIILGPPACRKRKKYEGHTGRR